MSVALQPNPVKSATCTSSTQKPRITAACNFSFGIDWTKFGVGINNTNNITETTRAAPITVYNKCNFYNNASDASKRKRIMIESDSEDSQS